MIEKLKAVLTISRPVNVVITFVSVVIATIICLPTKIPELYVLLAAFSAALTAASGNIINDIFDIEIDKINRPLRPLPSVKITVKEAYTLYFVLLILSISFSLIISYLAFIIVIISNLLLLLYAKYLKRIPLIGNITVAFLTGMVFIFGGVVVENPSAAIIPATFALLVNLIREIVKDMQDFDGDEKNEIKTFPVKFGFQKSKFIILFISLALILYTLYPFITQIYRIEYFIVVMIIVNPILVYCLKILFQDHSLKNLNKISNLLKISMVFGLIAIFLGV